MGFISKEKGYWTVQNLSTSFFLPEDTLHTFINECEGSSLQTISPHLKAVSGG
jgi:hypothetical protein